MRSLIGSHDLLLVTLDTLRYDVAADLAATGRTPQLAKVLPGGRWEARHSPASFTYAAHHAFFAGFLPTPVTPGRHERLYASRFPGSETAGPGTWVFDAPDLPTALADVGYHTVCLGGVGFFNRRSALGSVLPGRFAEAHWEPEFGVTSPTCLDAQLDRLAEVLARVPAGQPLFTFLNVSALHQPNRHYLPTTETETETGTGTGTATGTGTGTGTDDLASHAAALEYVDGRIGRLFALVTGRGRPVFTIVCSDHGTAYGEDGHTGHRIGHDVVWTVPYAHFTLHPEQPSPEQS